MTFLNPLVLFGLAAAAIPVILHLLNLRKLRTIEFSTLTFLKELQQTKIRRLKIRQLLLLVIRTLLVVLLVLAFARPALQGSLVGHIGTHAHSSVVFIFDDSFSMKAADEYGDFFKQAKETAGRLIDLLSEGDEAFLVKFSDLPQATVEPATHDFDALRTMIRESHVSPIRRPIEDAIRLSAKLLAESKNANKEVYIISDLQRTLFPVDRIQGQSRTPALFDDRVRFFVADIGTKVAPNAAIDSVEVTTKILEINKPATVYASVRNFSSSALRNYVVSVFLDGVHAAQGNVQVEPWGSASVNFTLTPKRAGFLKGYVELENDALDEDNTRFFTMSIPKRINVTISSNSKEDARYPLLALESNSGEGENSLLNVQHVESQKFSFVDLKNVDVLVLMGTKSFSSGTIDRIRDFVERGGGLILFPGSDFQPNDFNAGLLPALSVPTVESVMSFDAQSTISFQSIDFDHPLFATVFEKSWKGAQDNKRAIESPAILTVLKRQTGIRGRSIITLSDGHPFLSEHNPGEGRILFYSVAPVPTWSDFQLKGIFVPLMYRSVLYVSSREQSQASSTVGDEAFIRLPGNATTATGQFTLVAPDGSEEYVRPSGTAFSEGSKTAKSSEERWIQRKLMLPGIYEVRNSSTPVSVLAANVDARESDGRRISGDELSEFWKRFGVQSSFVRFLGHGEQLQSAVVQSRFGVELWKYLIGLALLLALLEMIVARDSKKEAQSLFPTKGS